MKYVLDENCTVRDEELPENVINARDLYYNNGLREHGVEDQKLLRLATQHGYLIITQDQRLVVRANQQNIDIVYAHGRSGKNWFFISKNSRVTNRLRLKQFIQRETIIQANVTVVSDQSLIPYFMKGGNKLK